MGRLIDADELHRKLFEIGCHKSKLHPMDVMKMIEEQPTAYDVDKVVEQMEEFRDEMKMFGCDGLLSDLIEVVKGGGVDDN